MNVRNWIYTLLSRKFWVGIGIGFFLASFLTVVSAQEISDISVLKIDELVWVGQYQFKTGTPRTYLDLKTNSFLEIPDKDFTDDDNNGLISVEVYTDGKNNVYKKITENLYDKKIIINGYKNNPDILEEKSKFQEYLESSIKKAEASIAFATSSTGWVASASSLTFPINNQTAGNALLVGIFSFSSGDAITGVTYNGFSLTQLGKRACDASGYCYAYGGLQNSTGVNNIVLNYSTNVQIFASATLYAGVHQSDPFPLTAVTSAINSTIIANTITTTYNDMQLWAMSRSPSRSPTAVAPAVFRVTNPVSGDASNIFDSIGSTTIGAQNLTYTYSPSQTGYTILTAMRSADSVATTSQPMILLLNQYMNPLSSVSCVSSSTSTLCSPSYASSTVQITPSNILIFEVLFLMAFVMGYWVVRKLT